METATISAHFPIQFAEALCAVQHLPLEARPARIDEITDEMALRGLVRPRKDGSGFESLARELAFERTGGLR
jgi:hypothetical protein